MDRLRQPDLRHVWHGASATQDWLRDVLIDGEHVGAKEYQVTLGKPLHANVTGDAAHVVVPATMTFKLKGKPPSAEVFPGVRCSGPNP